MALAADSIVGFVTEAGADIAAGNATGAATLASQAAFDSVVATSLAASTQPIAVRSLILDLNHDVKLWVEDEIC